jgi:hypothetical protein
VVVAVVVVVGAVDVEAVSVAVGVVSVEVGVVSVGVISVDVELLSLGAEVGSVAVELLSVEVPPSNVIPRAPEASIPALSKATNAKKIPARRSVFRPFISPAPLSPR